MDKDEAQPDPQMLRDLDFLLDMDIAQNKKDWTILNLNIPLGNLEQNSEEPETERK